MFVLIKNRRQESILLGLDENTSSNWQLGEESCFTNWKESNLSTWTSLHNQGFTRQIEYLSDHYKVIDLYIKKDKFIKITKETHPEYYL